MSSPLQHDRQIDSYSNRYDYGPSPHLQAYPVQAASVDDTMQIDIPASPQASPGAIESPPPSRFNLTPSVLARNVAEHKIATPVSASEECATPKGSPVERTPPSASQKDALDSLSALAPQNDFMIETPDAKTIDLMESELFSKASAAMQRAAAPPKEDAIAQSDTPQQAALKADVDFWQSAIDDDCKVRSLGCACIVFP